MRDGTRRANKPNAAARARAASANHIYDPALRVAFGDGIDDWYAAGSPNNVDNINGFAERRAYIYGRQHAAAENAPRSLRKSPQDKKS